MFSRVDFDESDNGIFVIELALRACIVQELLLQCYMLIVWVESCCSLKFLSEHVGIRKEKRAFFVFHAHMKIALEVSIITVLFGCR